ncbi:HdeD family acid-resistance protein [Streptomyces sp. GS7]|uniref:HdeD family acid-resistance protein n=1 Tax=Streptomyces sp. GS7 TaxID=2692234 RepID=UPI001317468F|nr:HdeD family acid-resistance protein [Streptomyces sp. GS7]QHC22749.1 HdeD family acid-resistance protein [Streptomyces sp. GS7]
MPFPSESAGNVPPRETRPEGASPGGEALGALANLGWQALVTVGLAAIALGVVVLSWPGETLRVVGVAFGVYLLVSGVFQLAAAFGAHVPGHLRALHFITGALFMLLGLVSFRGTFQSILLLALWIGFGWLLRGVMMTAAAGSSPGMPARGWQMFLGIITMLAGIVLIVAPFGSIAVLTLVTGIMAIVLGMVEVFHAFQLRVDAGRLTKGTAPKQRRSLFHMPHPQH